MLARSESMDGDHLPDKCSNKLIRPGTRSLQPAGTQVLTPHYFFRVSTTAGLGACKTSPPSFPTPPKGESETPNEGQRSAFSSYNSRRFPTSFSLDRFCTRTTPTTVIVEALLSRYSTWACQTTTAWTPFWPLNWQGWTPTWWHWTSAGLRTMMRSTRPSTAL